jgi:hypothetical protein
MKGWGNWEYYWDQRLMSVRHSLQEDARAAHTRAEHSFDAIGGRGGEEETYALEHVQISGFGVHFSQVGGVHVVNGRHVELRGLDISNHGGLGLGLDGWHLLASNLEIANIACGAVQLSGGEDMCLGSDPNSCIRGAHLRDAGNVFEHSKVHNFGRLCRAYMPGVSFDGAGHHVRSNTIFNAPHAGLFGRGNDCVFQHNTLRHLAYESTDTGGFTTGRSWVRRGNVIANNRFESVKNTQGMSLGFRQVTPARMHTRTHTHTHTHTHT